MVLVADKPSNAIGILQTPLRHREGHEARRGGLAPRPWDPPRDGGPGAREARLTIGPASLHPLWHRAAQRQPRAPRRHPQTVLPGPTLPQCEVGGRTRRGLAAGVTPDTPPAVHVSNEPLHGVRGAMGRRPVPP